jgi:hypothetical protein
VDFGDRAARESDPGSAGRERLLRRLFTEAQDVGEAAGEDGLEGGGGHGVFAFCSP